MTSIYGVLNLTPIVAGQYEAKVRPDFDPSKEVRKKFEVKKGTGVWNIDKYIGFICNILP